MSHVFGQKLRQLREERGLSQYDLARRLGYAGNSYVHDIEKGLFVPSPERMAAIARALNVSLDVLKEMALEVRIEELGIREPEFVSMFKDYPRLTPEDKRAIVKAYQEVKRRRSDGQGGR